MRARQQGFQWLDWEPSLLKRLQISCFLTSILGIRCLSTKGVAARDVSKGFVLCAACAQEVASIVYCPNWEIILESFLESSDLEAQPAPAPIPLGCQCWAVWSGLHHSGPQQQGISSGLGQPRPGDQPAQRQRQAEAVSVTLRKALLQSQVAVRSTWLSWA